MQEGVREKELEKGLKKKLERGEGKDNGK